MPKKMKKEGKPSVHEELDGFDIKIDTFGEMKTNFDIDKLNNFLDANVKDKKLTNRELDQEE